MKSKIILIQLSLFVTIFLLTIPLTAISQEEDLPLGQRRERIEIMKTAFITRHVGFTRAEAAVFWPIYNEYQEENFQLNRAIQSQIDEMRNPASLSDIEAEELLSVFMKNREASKNLRIKFLNDVRAVLPARKVLLFLQAERQFNRELLKRARE